MKYVKIFDSQMRPLGVLQLGAELAQSEETKYVKVYDENLDKCNGVVALSDNISEADAAKNIKIYDANLILIGGSTVGEISGESPVKQGLYVRKLSGSNTSYVVSNEGRLVTFNKKALIRAQPSVFDGSRNADGYPDYEQIASEWGVDEMDALSEGEKELYGITYNITIPYQGVYNITPDVKEVYK